MTSKLISSMCVWITEDMVTSENVTSAGTTKIPKLNSRSVRSLLFFHLPWHYWFHSQLYHAKMMKCVSDTSVSDTFKILPSIIRFLMCTLPNITFFKKFFTLTVLKLSARRSMRAIRKVGEQKSTQTQHSPTMPKQTLYFGWKAGTSVGPFFLLIPWKT